MDTPPLPPSQPSRCLGCNLLAFMTSYHFHLIRESGRPFQTLPFFLGTGLLTLFLPVSIFLPPSLELAHPYHTPLTVGLPLAPRPAASGEREAGSLHPSPVAEWQPAAGHLPVFLAVILEPCLSRRTNTSLLQWFTMCKRRPLRVWILTKHLAMLPSPFPSVSSACHSPGQLPPAIVALTFH